MTDLPANPFRLVHDALWAMLLRHPSINELVALGNRISFGSANDRAPVKPEMSSADVPEVMLMSAGVADVNLYASSSSSKITRAYTWQVYTGDERISAFLYPIEWAIYCAMTGWQTTLTALRYNDKQFVTMCNLVQASEGRIPSELTAKGLMGWYSMWTCQVQMYFETARLTAELTEG